MAKKDSRHRDYVTMFVRLPPDMKEWLEQQAAQSYASQNAEVIRAIRMAMKQQAREAAQA
jgi:predicted HicB family RNase H-like nuclease